MDPGLKLWGIMTATVIVLSDDSPTLVKAAARLAKVVFHDRIQICDGTNDEVEIQAAIDALPAAGGSVILLEGNYSVETVGNYASHYYSINIVRSDVALIGERGIKITLADSQHANTSVILVGNDTGAFENVTIKGLTIDGNKANQPASTRTTAGIAFWGFITNSSIEGCTVENSKFTAIWLFHSSDKNKIIKNRVRDGDQIGIGLDGASECLVEQNIVTGCSSVGINSFFNSDNNVRSDNNIITSNQVSSCLSGISVAGGVANQVIGNQVFSCTEYGIWLQSFVGAVNKYGGDRHIVSGNISHDNWRGIDLVGNTSEALYMEYCDVTENVVYNNSNWGLTLGEHTRYCLVADNIWVGTYGLQELADANHNMIMSNLVRGGSAANRILASGANTVVRDNIDFITENSGTATILAANTSIVVNHGLDVTPVAGDIMVTPMEDIGNATKFRIDTYTATQFTIHVDVAPGADTDFAWKAIVL